MYYASQSRCYPKPAPGARTRGPERSAGLAGRGALPKEAAAARLLGEGSLGFSKDRLRRDVDS